MTAVGSENLGEVHLDEAVEDASSVKPEVISKKDERLLSEEDRKLARKNRKLAAKEQKQAKRQSGRKSCERCEKQECEVLIRCSCKEWQGWRLVCGKCWKDVSGGVPDGDLDHPDYRYGGLWRYRKGESV